MLGAKIQKFWDNQAKEFGASGLATAPDSAYRELEMNSIIPFIKGGTILDVGCGNGFSTFRFALVPENRGKTFFGVDYSKQMIKEANHRLKITPQETATGGRHPKIKFHCMDVRHMRRFHGKIDCIISERCVINLKSWKQQQLALLEMKKCLTPKGRIIFVENFIDGLDNLNALRNSLGLHDINVRWHNRYLKKREFYDFCGDHFNIPHIENIGNLYYIISRVVYAALAKQNGKEPEYANPINSVAAKLPSLGTYDYSPNWLHILEI